MWCKHTLINDSWYEHVGPEERVVRGDVEVRAFDGHHLAREAALVIQSLGRGNERGWVRVVELRRPRRASRSRIPVQRAPGTCCAPHHHAAAPVPLLQNVQGHQKNHRHLIHTRYIASQLRLPLPLQWWERRTTQSLLGFLRVATASGMSKNVHIKPPKKKSVPTRIYLILEVNLSLSCYAYIHVRCKCQWSTEDYVSG